MGKSSPWRRVLDRVGDIDSIRNIISAVLKVISWWPVYGPILVGVALLIWVALKGNFGPILVGIILAMVTLMAVSSIWLANGITWRRDRRMGQVQSAPTQVPSTEASPPGRFLVGLDVVIRQGQDLWSALERTKPRSLPPTLIQAIRTWGYRTEDFLQYRYPGIATFFRDELPLNRGYPMPGHRDYAEYVRARLEDLAKIRREESH